MVINEYFFFHKTSLQPASHNFPIEISELCASPVKTWDFLAAYGSDGKLNWHCADDRSCITLGKPTVMLGISVFLLSHGASGVIYDPDAPVLPTAIVWSTLNGWASHVQLESFSSTLFLTFQPLYQVVSSTALHILLCWHPPIVFVRMASSLWTGTLREKIFELYV